MNIFTDSIPEAAPTDIVAWAEANVKVDGHSFDSQRTPQLIEPIRFINNPEYRVGTLMKPVQCGGSTVGEIAMAWWLRFATGLIQFNWQDDQKAAFRWKQRLLPLLEKLDGLKWAGGFDKTICEARMVNAMLLVQGVISKGSLDSDTIPLQINEEVHLWAAGLLDKARRRQSQVWNSKALDISNAGILGDQLDAAYEEGTMEVWDTFCPGCGNPNFEANKVYHPMRFRWDDKRPELGGLRFDTEAGRGGEKFSLNNVLKTIRYQMPCGWIMRDIASERKQPGRYRITNEGAPSYKRSWNFDAVSVAEIKWPDLVSEWLKACKAKSAGDLEPLKKFIQERECRPFSDDLVPFKGAIVINQGIQKSRSGLEGRQARLWAADKQKGYRSKGELSHYWLVIRDVMPNGDSCLVFEGQIQTDNELLAVLDEYECKRYAGVIDASWDTQAVLEFCLRNGLNAVMANNSGKGQFLHKADKVWRFYSEAEPVHRKLNTQPRHEYIATPNGWIPATEEPMVINYNLAGLLANLFFIRDFAANVGEDIKQPIKFEVPADASEEYQLQASSWERRAVKQAKTNDEVEGFRKICKDDHMLMCEGYIAMLMQISGVIGSRLAEMGFNQNNNTTK